MASSLPSESEYPSTPLFTPTPRFLATLQTLRTQHLLDPASESLAYHSSLEAYVRKLCLLASSPSFTDDAPSVLKDGPSEALLLAANAQHVRRWEKPRSGYPEGLAGYKMWRTQLNKFHKEVAEEAMRACGYRDAEDPELFRRVGELLLKKTLARPPLPAKLSDLRGAACSFSPSFARVGAHRTSVDSIDPSRLADPEMHLFEDAICLTFLALQFSSFASTVSDSDKLVGIVRKTWAKMTLLGRHVAGEELVGGLDDELKAVVLKAVSE
ncbi:SPOSA6832_02423, partial [Sporobolomyces salmonicolor]